MQRLIGSVGVEALPGCIKQSFDKYCDVNCMRRDLLTSQLLPRVRA
ncbi:MAG: hypothetical protein M3Q91_02200 [Acidobacteriota bacterium]|nr:hypothetical protein [Acidobacteriota bacterium]